jgi:hypothetical protein
LKKRTKKLLLPWTVPVGPPVAHSTAEGNQSFFASFCSQKEVLSYLRH